MIIITIIYDDGQHPLKVRITCTLFPKEQVRFLRKAPEVPEGSNFFLNVLREASPLAAF